MTVLLVRAREQMLYAGMYNPKLDCVTAHFSIDLQKKQPILKFEYEKQDKQMSIEKTLPDADIENALSTIIDTLIDHDITDISLIAQHMIHGGTKYHQPVYISEQVLEHLHEMDVISPHDTHASLLVSLSLQKMLPNVKQVAVFDTAFHKHMPQENYEFAIPQEFRDAGVRKYGFYGITHHAAFKQTRKQLAKSDPKDIISCYMNAVVSVCAISQGKSVNTTMGFSPLSGPIGRFKSGELDPGAVFYLAKVLDKNPEDILKQLHTQSGLYALCNSTSFEHMKRHAKEGSLECELALQKYIKEVARHIASMHIDVPNPHAVVFSGSVVEESPWMVEEVCKQLASFGIVSKKVTGFDVDITGPNSRSKILLVPDMSMLEVGRQAMELHEK